MTFFQHVFYKLDIIIKKYKKISCYFGNLML